MAGLRLPNETSSPTERALALLAKYSIGEIIDSGPVTSAWSTGEIVVTDLGVALLDIAGQQVIGVAWIDVALEMVDEPTTPGSDVELRFSIHGASIDLRMDRRLFENIEGAAAVMADGAPGRKPCPECGRQSRQGDKFCHECGTSLSLQTVQVRRSWRPFRR